MLKQVTIAFLLWGLCFSQACYNHEGQTVSWFLVINPPSSESKGHLYFDSTFTADQFVYHQAQSDDQGNPIYSTLSSFNDKDVQISAWNDDLPDENADIVLQQTRQTNKKAPKGPKCKNTKTNQKAHSKSVIAFDSETKNGVLVDHSLPQFPRIKNKKVLPQIPQKQRKFGQHFLCLTTSDQVINDILEKSTIIKPNYYPNSIKTKQSNQCAQFEHSQFNVSQTPVKAIFKNGIRKNSIFEDGLTDLLKSDILAQTWGRPYQPSQCQAEFKVKNIKKLTFDSQIQWKNTKDHSKWAISATPKPSFSCFGDMNRMTSQFERGGAFYCLQHKNLRKALKKLITEIEECPQ